MGISLVDLPPELFFIVIEDLDFEDIFNLGNSCGQMRWTMGQGILNQRLVERHISHAAEVTLVRQGRLTYDEAARRVFNRREAIATGQPVSASVLGYGLQFLYRSGILVYLTTDAIRVLDVHQSGHQEKVLDLRRTMRSHFPAWEGPGSPELTFKLLNYSHDYLICVCKKGKPASASFLLTIWFGQEPRPTRQAVIWTAIDDTTKIFARNDGSYVFYGTHSEIGIHSHREWVIRGLDLATGRKLDGQVYLRGFVGSEPGLTVCFEIFDGYFYALSNQTSFEVEEVDWTSFFHVYRFPVDRPKQKFVQMQNDIWRRNHEEGTLCDSWTDLKLQRDETTGSLMIVETRREWIGDGLSSQRVHYTLPLDMSHLPETTPIPDFVAQLGLPHQHQHPPDAPPPDLAPTTGPPPPHPPPTAPPVPATTSSPPPDAPPEISCRDYARVYNLPDEPLTRALTEGNRPNFAPPQARLARHVHRADDTAPPTYILAKTKIRHYSPSSNSFLDLVDHPRTPPAGSGAYCNEQSLHLRVGARRRLPPPRDATTGLLIPVPLDADTGEPRPEALETYAPRGEKIRLWPEVDGRLETARERYLHKILNPVRCNEGAGEVAGVADERSVVYMTGDACGARERRAIVLVNFDAGIRLKGLRIAGELDGSELEVGGGEKGGGGVGELRVAKGKGMAQGVGRRGGWWMEEAAYIGIDRGLWLLDSPYAGRAKPERSSVGATSGTAKRKSAGEELDEEGSAREQAKRSKSEESCSFSYTSSSSSPL